MDIKGIYLPYSVNYNNYQLENLSKWKKKIEKKDIEDFKKIIEEEYKDYPPDVKEIQNYKKIKIQKRKDLILNNRLIDIKYIMKNDLWSFEEYDYDKNEKLYYLFKIVDNKITEYKYCVIDQKYIKRHDSFNSYGCVLGDYKITNILYDKKTYDPIEIYFTLDMTWKKVNINNRQIITNTNIFTDKDQENKIINEKINNHNYIFINDFYDTDTYLDENKIFENDINILNCFYNSDIPINLNEIKITISDIIKNNINQENKLMPSENSYLELVQLLKNKFKDENLFKNMDLNIWLKFIGNFDIKNNILFRYLININNNNYDKIYSRIKDLSGRSNALVKEMINKNIKKIHLMDGHGRFIMALYRSLILNGENINNYTIYVYDTDEYVNKWHEIFFPKVIISYKKNIFDILENNIKNIEWCKENIIYLNFCGLSNQCEKLVDNINNLISNKHLYDLKYRIFLSTSERNSLSSYNNKFISNSKYQFIRSDIVLFKTKGSLIRENGNYVTYLLDFKKIHDLFNNKRKERDYNTPEKIKKELKPIKFTLDDTIKYLTIEDILENDNYFQYINLAFNSDDKEYELLRNEIISRIDFLSSIKFDQYQKLKVKLSKINFNGYYSLQN